MKIPGPETVNTDQSFALFKPQRTVLRYSPHNPLPVIETVVIAHSNVIPDFPLAIRAFPVMEPKTTVESFLLNRKRQPYRVSDDDYDEETRKTKIVGLYKNTADTTINDAMRLNQPTPNGWVNRFDYPYYLSIGSFYAGKDDKDFYASVFNESFKGFNIDSPIYKDFVESCRFEIVYGQNRLTGSREPMTDGLDFGDFLPPGVLPMARLGVFPVDEIITVVGSGFSYPMISNRRKEIGGLRGKLFVPGEPFDPVETAMEPALREVPGKTWSIS